jgi:hypothetical protein
MAVLEAVEHVEGGGGTRRCLSSVSLQERSGILFVDGLKVVSPDVGPCARRVVEGQIAPNDEPMELVISCSFVEGSLGCVSNGAGVSANGRCLDSHHSKLSSYRSAMRQSIEGLRGESVGRAGVDGQQPIGCHQVEVGVVELLCCVLGELGGDSGAVALQLDSHEEEGRQPDVAGEHTKPR